MPAESSGSYPKKLPLKVVRDVIRITRKNKSIPALYSSDIINQKIYYDTLEDACEYFKWYVNSDSRCVRVDDIVNFTDNIMQFGMIDSKEMVFSLKEALKKVDATVMTLPFESTHFGGKDKL